MSGTRRRSCRSWAEGWLNRSCTFKDKFYLGEVIAHLRLTWCLYFQVPKLAKSQLEVEGGGMNISERLSDGWVDAYAMFMLVVEIKVQQGDIFMMSNIALFNSFWGDNPSSAFI